MSYHFALFALMGFSAGAWKQAGKHLRSPKPNCFLVRAWTPWDAHIPLGFAPLQLLLSPHSGGHFMSTAEKIRLPDDCTIGYIIESVLGVKLIRSNLFHSHLENLHQVPKTEIHKQVTLP